MFTGTPGFIPLENLRGTIAASPDQDVWSLAMVSLVVLLAERGYHHYLPCCKVWSRIPTVFLAFLVVTRWRDDAVMSEWVAG